MAKNAKGRSMISVPVILVHSARIGPTSGQSNATANDEPTTSSRHNANRSRAFSSSDGNGNANSYRSEANGMRIVTKALNMAKFPKASGLYSRVSRGTATRARICANPAAAAIRKTSLATRRMRVRSWLSLRQRIDPFSARRFPAVLRFQVSPRCLGIMRCLCLSDNHAKAAGSESPGNPSRKQSSTGGCA